MSVDNTIPTLLRFQLAHVRNTRRRVGVEHLGRQIASAPTCHQTSENHIVSTEDGQSRQFSAMYQASYNGNTKNGKALDASRKTPLSTVSSCAGKQILCRCASSIEHHLITALPRLSTSKRPSKSFANAFSEAQPSFDELQYLLTKPSERPAVSKHPFSSTGRAAALASSRTSDCDTDMRRDDCVSFCKKFLRTLTDISLFFRASFT